MSIFLSISSYRDPLLANTLTSAYENAADKDNLIFAVVDQNNKKLNTNQFNFAQQIRYLFLDYTYACLLYTSPSPRDLSTSRMPSSA